MSRNQTALYKQKVVVLKGAHLGKSRCHGSPLVSGDATVVQNLPGPEYGRKRNEGGDTMNLWNEDEKWLRMI